MIKGSLYAMAKGGDQEIVRPFERNLKVEPWMIELEFCLVMGLQVYFKDI